ncbi:hypothetical protein D9M69_558610 [compost metagenome]
MLPSRPTQPSAPATIRAPAARRAAAPVAAVIAPAAETAACDCMRIAVVAPTVLTCNTRISAWASAARPRRMVSRSASNLASLAIPPPTFPAILPARRMPTTSAARVALEISRSSWETTSVISPASFLTSVTGWVRSSNHFVPRAVSSRIRYSCESNR